MCYFRLLTINIIRRNHKNTTLNAIRISVFAISQIHFDDSMNGCGGGKEKEEEILFINNTLPYWEIKYYTW